MTNGPVYFAAAITCVLLGLAVSPIIGAAAAVVLIVHAVIAARKGGGQ